jgi:uncharacterized LabA/DUF88 family protein
VFQRYIDGERTNNKLKTVVLVTGDGDFLDLALLFKKRLRIKFIIVSFRSSLSEDLISSLGEDNVFYLDDFGFSGYKK